MRQLLKIRLFHRHLYFEVDRQWLERTPRNLVTGELLAGGPSPVTLITERCATKSCGKYRQETLQGYLPGGEPKYCSKKGVEQ